VRRLASLAIAVVTAVAAVALIATTAGAGGRPFSTPLSGAEEAPGPGDPDGTGSASLQLNQGQNRVCFTLDWQNIGPPTAAHIHKAPPGVAGPIVVGLGPVRSGCVSDVDAALIKDIRQNPGDYYVNIHTQEFPGGAIRGQLEK
jgi:hypothetical protein